jgi:hypothetical protein
LKTRINIGIGVSTRRSTRIVDGGAYGSHALHLDKDFCWSGSFRIPPGAKVTLSASVRAVADKAHVHFFLVPNARGAGVEPFRVFWGKSGVGQDITSREWKRLSWDIDIPGPDFAWASLQWWDRKGWMLFPTGENIEIDGISITLDGSGKDAYIPFSPVEITTEASNLPGYNPTCNILDPTTPIALTTLLSNPGTTARNATVRWQLLDYTGQRVFAELGSKTLVLKPNDTQRLVTTVPLTAKGLMIARATVCDANGTRLGSSDQPLTVLAFPKRATKPDPTERFGGSFATSEAGTFLVADMQHVGFAWSRWYPCTDWPRIQPDAGDRWNWPDQQVDDLESHGFSLNAVIYNGMPKWAQGTHPYLPKDMESWKADDPRWSDLTIETSYDRFVKALVTHFKNRSIAWEVANEPLWQKWDPALYARFVERTYRIVKSICPTGKVMTDGCYGIDELHRGFLAHGGNQFHDVFTFHNYGASGYFATGDQVRAMHDAFKTAGKDVEVWFNEGWTHWPSSEDTPAWSVFADRGPVQVVNEAVRCTAETFAAGMNKLILFHLGYTHQGRSWWDWNGDGTVLFDDAHQPTVAVGAFNVLIDQLGRSTHVASVRGTNTTWHTFQDDRNHRGVAVAWGDDAGATLSLGATDLQMMDVMGNCDALPANGGTTAVTFSHPGQPFYIFTSRSSSGTELAKLLAPFEKPNVLLAEGVYGLPSDWLAQGKSGNPYVYKGKPIWRLGRVYPPDLKKSDNYRDFTEWLPAEVKWFDAKDSSGGNPAASLDGGLRMTGIAPWKGGDQTKPSCLSFIAPIAATYDLDGVLHSERWTGNGGSWLEVVVLDRAKGTARSLQRLPLPDRLDTAVRVEGITLASGEELALVYGIDGMFTGAGCTFPKLTIRQVVGHADVNAPPH